MEDTNQIFYGMEKQSYKTIYDELDKYMNFTRLPNKEYIERHLYNKERYKYEKLYVGDLYNKVFALNINHYFPEGYNILPSYKKVNVNNGLELGVVNHKKYIVLKIIEELYKVKAILFLGEDEKKTF